MVVCLLVDKRFWMSARVVAIFTLGVLGAVSFLASLGLGTGVLRISGIDDGSSWAFYSSVTRAWEFAVGAILALVLARPGFRLGATVGNVLAFAGMATLAAGSFAISESTLFPGTAALVPVAGTAALIAAGTAQDTPYITRALSTPVMIWIGALSYSWYLWHWPVIVFTQQMFPGREFVVTLAGLASLLPAWLAYRFVENPIRRNGRLVGRRAVALITVAILVPAAASLALLFGSQQSWGSPQITSMTDQIAPVPVSFMRGCDNGNALGRQEGFDCTWGSESRGRPVYLIGDSQAAQFAEATIGAAAQLGRPLTIATMGSCPFITTLPGEEPLSAPECEDFVDDSIAWLTSQPPATVAVGMSGNYVTPEYRQVLEERLIRSIRRLQEHGHQVAVFQAIPQFPEWSPFTCTVFDSLADPRGCGVEVSRRAMDERQALALDLIKDVAERTGSRLIDVRSTLEVGDSYATNDENVWIFRDPFHITVNMSSMLTGEVLKGISL
jgi:hypothetical protein